MNRNPFFLLPLCASALALSACSTFSLHPSREMAPATLSEELPPPVRIVEVPEPLPLPGQLQPDPHKGQPKPPVELKSPEARVSDANKAALKEPSQQGYINAIQVYPFTDGALYQLYATPERVSDIMLQPGEQVLSVSAGDTTRWTVGDTQSGAGEATQVHILVKPFAAGLKTNLVITTDRRTYHLQLESTESTFMAGLSWSYPLDTLAILHRQNGQAAAAQPIATQIALDHINFNYTITGDKPSWRPLRVFDDAQKVYIEFPKRITQDKAPPLFVLGREGESDLVNYRMRGTYYIVDRLFDAAELRLGTAPQQVVRITRTANGE